MLSIKYEDFSNNYDLFVKLCEITSEPVKLVKEGRPDLIVMNAEAFGRRKKALDLREKLLRQSGDEPIDSKVISLEQLGKCIDDLETCDGEDKK